MQIKTELLRKRRLESPFWQLLLAITCGLGISGIEFDWISNVYVLICLIASLWIIILLLLIRFLYTNSSVQYGNFNFTEDGVVKEEEGMENIEFKLSNVNAVKFKPTTDCAYEMSFMQYGKSEKFEFRLPSQEAFDMFNDLMKKWRMIYEDSFKEIAPNQNV